MIPPIADMTNPGGHQPPPSNPVDRVVARCQPAGGDHPDRGDRVQLSREAGELAHLAAVIRQLEQAVTGCDSKDDTPRPNARPCSVATIATAEPTESRTDASPRAVQATTLVIQPTVYTNLGSLMDVFA
jgi:hypothetical protein